MQTFAMVRAELELVAKRTDDKDIQALARLMTELANRIEKLDLEQSTAKSGKPRSPAAKAKRSSG